MAIDETLIDAFVASTEQDRSGAGGKLADRRLAQWAARRREIHERRRRGLGTIGANRGERPSQRLGEQHHARTTAVGPIVDAGMRRVTEIAQLPEPDVDLACFESTSRHAVNEMRFEQFGKERDDVESHGRALRIRGPSRP